MNEGGKTMITIVGLGPGDKRSLTIGAIESLKQCKNVFLRTEKHPIVEFIRELGIDFKCYDNQYESNENFDDVYSKIALDLIEKESELKDIVYAVPGHAMVAEKSVSLLIDMCKENNISYTVMPAVSFLEAIMQRLNIDPIDGFRIIDAFDMDDVRLSNKEGIIVTQVYDNFIASKVKIALCKYYKESEEIYFVRAAGIEGQESIRKIKLYEIDRQRDIDYLTSLYVPKGTKAYRDFYDLVNIVSELRKPNGCPWDREQNHLSITRDLIEECYETVDAIESGKEEDIIEELGDVLFQVVFHSEIGSDQGYFNIYDVTEGVCEKMILRHPHVFGNLTLDSTEKVLDNWNSIKKQEKDFKTYTDELRHVAKALPGLIRAEKVQKKASKVGFDWDDVKAALDKIKEEYTEVFEVYNKGNVAKIVDELGDLFFSVVNVCRFLDVDPEDAINHTTNKFIERFSHIEDCAKDLNKDLKDMSLNEMDYLWEQAKSL